MAAIQITPVTSGGPISGGAAASAPGLVEATYTGTIITTLDWFILSDFDEIKFAWGYVTATGVDAVVYVDGSTKNKLFVTGTGAVTVLVKGTPANTD